MQRNTGLTALIERLIERLNRECEQYPAGFAGVPAETLIDDGGRYLPQQNVPPTWVHTEDRPRAGHKEQA